MKIKKEVYLFVFACIILTSGCADSVSFTEAANMNPVGFWYGLWHGFMLPISWVVSLFSGDTAIYAIYNNGGWYDYGFYLGASSSAMNLISMARRR